MVKLKFSLLKIKSYIFFALMINNCATNETIIPTTAAIINNATPSLNIFIFFLLKILISLIRV